MAIRPADIRRKEFRSGLRGYDANQVDDFLDEVADEFERSYSESQRLAEEVENLRGRLEQFEQLEASIQTAIVHAEEVSRELRQNANKEAELIVREAQEQAHRILADSSGRVDRVQESYDVLRQAKQEFANDFRNLLKSYLAVMDNADIATAKEIEASLRERLDLESLAVTRQAAETRRSERGSERGDPTADTGDIGGGAAGSGDATRRIETAATPSGDVADQRGPDPEVDEPEVEPSTAESPTGRQRAVSRYDAAGPLDATDEVDREEPTPAREGRAYDEFFDEREPRRSEPAEERKLFRASRFLRRRG